LPSPIFTIGCRDVDLFVSGQVVILRSPVWARQTFLKGMSPMKKYLIAATFTAGIAAPALAVETNFIMFDNTMKGCTIGPPSQPTSPATR
jgi:hypothetical protein